MGDIYFQQRTQKNHGRLPVMYSMSFDSLEEQIGEIQMKIAEKLVYLIQQYIELKRIILNDKMLNCNTIFSWSNHKSIYSKQRIQGKKKDLLKHGRDPSSYEGHKNMSKLTETVRSLAGSRKNLHSPKGRKKKNETHAYLSVPYTQPIAMTWNNEMMSSGSGTE